MLEEFLPAAPVLLVLLGGTIAIVFEGAVPRLVRPTVQAAWALLVSSFHKWPRL